MVELLAEHLDLLDLAIDLLEAEPLGEGARAGIVGGSPYVLEPEALHMLCEPK